MNGGGELTLELKLLGTFDVRVDGRAIARAEWRHRRAAEIVKILALERSHRLHREQIMDALWPDLTPEAAAANLRKAIHFARKTLSADAITTSGGVLELGSGRDVSVDSVEFEAAARAALRSKDRAAAETAAGLYVGELLPEDRYAPWAAGARERLRSLAIETLKVASRWEQVLEIDPVDEEAHRVLMSRALEEGDRTRAVRQFETLRQRLRIDLGMGPDPRSVSLYERAIAGEGDKALNGIQRVRVLLARAFVQLNNGRLDPAEQNAKEARRLAGTHGLSVEFNEATALLSIVSSLRRRWRDLFRTEFAEAVEGSNEIEARVFDAHLCVTEYHMFGPDGHEGMFEYANELRLMASASGSVRGEGVAEFLAGEAELFSGRVASAEKHLQVAVDLHQRAGATAAQVFAIQRLAECAAATNDQERARRLLNHGLPLARSSPFSAHLVVRMHEGLVRCGDGSTARHAIRASEEELTGRLFCLPCSLGFRLASVTKLAEMGAAGPAQQHLDVADDIATMWPDGYWHAAVIEARGTVIRARGAETEAVAMFLEAADRFAELGRPLDEARCRLQGKSRRGVRASPAGTGRRPRAHVGAQTL